MPCAQGRKSCPPYSTSVFALLCHYTTLLNPCANAYVRVYVWVEQGSEAANLNILIQSYMRWADDLFPSLTFEDFVDKLEDLGAKSKVKQYMSAKRRAYEQMVFEAEAKVCPAVASFERGTQSSKEQVFELGGHPVYILQL